MSPEELRKKLQELVDNAIEMYPHGNDGTEAMQALYEFWMDHRDVVKWAFWHGTGKQREVIDCHNGDPHQVQVGGKGNRQVIT